mmetsp:Transcript_8864/g.12442  ORF Transcript_8864/g.12442 Transcript_8864/m.12442 type:complete len:103 (+) Transcript_8864:24-332(+)
MASTAVEVEAKGSQSVAKDEYLVARIFSFMEAEDIVTSMPTCKSFMRAGDQNEKWKALFEKEFGRSTAIEATEAQKKCWRKFYLDTRALEMELNAAIYQGSC